MKRNPVALLLCLWLTWLLTGPMVQAAPPGQGEDRVTLILTNDSDQTICDVKISPTEKTHWGLNRLAKGETIPPREHRSFDMKAGSYKILLVDCEQNLLLEQRDLAITSSYELSFTGQTAAPPTDDPAAQ